MHFFGNWIRFARLFAPIALLLACQSNQPIGLERGPVDWLEQYVVTSNCRFVVRSIEDVRRDKSSLGNLGGINVTHGNVVNWLGTGLLMAGYEVELNGSTPESAGAIKTLLADSFGEVPKIGTILIDVVIKKFMFVLHRHRWQAL